VSSNITQGDEEICDLTAALPEQWQVLLRGVVFACVRVWVGCVFVSGACATCVFLDVFRCHIAAPLHLFSACARVCSYDTKKCQIIDHKRMFHVHTGYEPSLSRFLMLTRLQPIDPINFLKFGEDAFRRADESVVDGIARFPISQIEILSPVKISRCVPVADAKSIACHCLTACPSAHKQRILSADLAPDLQSAAAGIRKLASIRVCSSGGRRC
jgi:hypothetical protein